MNIKYNNNLCSSIIFKGNDVKYVEFIQGTPQLNVNYIIWAKPYTLTINKGPGVKTVTVTRTSTKVKDVSTNVTINSGDVIYHGDTLKVSAAANTGYDIDSYTPTISVDGNENVSITASAVKAIPTISDLVTGGEPSARYTAFKVTNHDKFACYVMYEIINTSTSETIMTGYTDKLEPGAYEGKSVKHYGAKGDYNVKVRVQSLLDIHDTSGYGWSDWYLATYTKLTLASPVISDTYVNNALTGCRATIYNPNEVPVTVYVKVWSYRDDTLEVDTSFELAAKTDVKAKFFSYANGINSSDMKFSVSFVAQYYNPSESYVDISYTGPEETTTRV